MTALPGAIPAIAPAGAYPPPGLPAAQLALMILVPAGLLLAWLTLVYLAARPGRDQRPAPLRPPAPLPRKGQAVAAPDAADTGTAGAQPRLTRSARG